MSYVKRYDVGQINVNLIDAVPFDEPPFVKYTHEQPLLSFGDVQHSINISLVFNYERYRDDKSNSKNSFFIAPGYKLNLQKKVKTDEFNIPIVYYGDDGESVSLRAVGNTATFGDDSKRVLRKKEVSRGLGTIPGVPIIPDIDTVIYNYTVEYPDFSKEKFNESGRITTVYDKYDNPYLSYTYDSSGRLISITYRNSKIVSLEYVSNRLDSLSYDNKSIKFFYKADGALDYVEHYTGVKYIYTLSKVDFADVYESDFEVQAASTDQSGSPISHTKQLKLRSDRKTIDVIDKIRHIEVNRVSYKHMENLLNYGPPFKYVDIIDKNGVETRVQFENNKAMCSYEIQNGSPVFYDYNSRDRFSGNVTLYDASSSSINTRAAGVQTRNDGFLMNYNSTNHQWSTTAIDYIQQEGYFTLSGWIKSDTSDVTSAKIVFSNLPDDGFTIDLYPTGQWQYFTHIFKASIQELTVYPDVYNYVSTRDFRITFQESQNNTDNGASHTNMTEYVLINGNDEIPIRGARFYYSVNDSNYEIVSDLTEDDVYENEVAFFDIMKFKLRKKRDGLCNEVYYNDCKDVFSGVGDLKVMYGSAPTGISSFDIGIREYFSKKKSLKRISIDENDPDSDIIITHTVEGVEISREKLNKNLDSLESTSKGVTVYYDYVSENCSLISKTTSAPVGVSKDNTSNSNVLVKQYNYDEDLTKLESAVDEFGKETVYTTDDVSGVITSTTLPDGMTITDGYDDGMSSLVSKSFLGSDNNSRSNMFYYYAGNVSKLISGTIYYDFSYLQDIVSEVSKFDYPIEKHSRSNNDKTLTSYYPSESSPVYTVIQNTDKYGRLTSVSDVEQKTYDINPTINPFDGDYIVTNIDNGSANLATSEDLTTGKKIKYAYDIGRLIRAGTFDSSGTKIDESVYLYDNIGRLTSETFIYSNNSKSVQSGIVYKKAETDPLADDRIDKYYYNVNGAEKALTYNGYDSFGRITSKRVSVDCNGALFHKSVLYDKTRVTSLSVVYGAGNPRGSNSYEYDDTGRIISDSNYNGSTGYPITYEYDTLGQLIRENNKALDKTFVYCYDGIGNITSVNTYGYTTGEVSGTPTTKIFTYSETFGDRLVSFNGQSITYNSIGYPTRYGDRVFTWDKGKLVRLYDDIDPNSSSSSDDYRFTYDAYGRRLSKVYEYDPGPDYSGNFTTKIETNYYYDHNGRLVRETSDEDFTESASIYRELIYLYDESGMVGVLYNFNNISTKAYYYHRNLQGDVISIFDQSGVRQAEYAYDAYGNCEIVYDASGTDIAGINPIRYRGYYYDRETKLYYLNSRYYNPEWRRFISPDDTSYLNPETPNGLNLYCYCNNDPVNFVDPSGHIALSALFISMAIGLGVGAIIGGTVEIGKQVISNGWNTSEWDWWQIARSTLGGGVAGAISAIPIPGTGFLSYLGTFATGGIASTLGGLVSGSVVSWGSAAFAFGLGGVANVCGRGLSDAIKHFKVGKQVNAISARARSIANMSAKKKSLTIWNMLGTDKFMRNAYKGWGYDQIFELLMSQPAAELAMFTVNNLTRYMVYSSVTSSILSGWY